MSERLSSIGVSVEGSVDALSSADEESMVASDEDSIIESSDDADSHTDHTPSSEGELLSPASPTSNRRTSSSVKSRGSPALKRTRSPSNSAARKVGRTNLNSSMVVRDPASDPTPGKTWQVRTVTKMSKFPKITASADLSFIEEPLNSICSSGYVQVNVCLDKGLHITVFSDAEKEVAEIVLLPCEFMPGLVPKTKKVKNKPGAYKPREYSFFSYALVRGKEKLAAKKKVAGYGDVLQYLETQYKCSFSNGCFELPPHAVASTMAKWVASIRRGSSSAKPLELTFEAPTPIRKAGLQRISLTVPFGAVVSMVKGLDAHNPNPLTKKPPPALSAIEAYFFSAFKIDLSSFTLVRAASHGGVMGSDGRIKPAVKDCDEDGEDGLYSGDEDEENRDTNALRKKYDLLVRVGEIIQSVFETQL